MDAAGRLGKVDSLVRSGRQRLALQELKHINLRHLSRSELANYANLAWRSGNATLALRALAPYVLPKPGMSIRASPRELLEYACALIRIGGFVEADRILSGLDPLALPKVNLYLAFTAISRWDYGAAIDPLTKFRAAVAPDSYDWAVASTNLAAALIASHRSSETLGLLNELQDEFTRRSYVRLLINVHELRCQTHVEAKNWEGAEAEIHLGRRMTTEMNSPESLFFDKWQAICEIMKTDGRGGAKAIAEVRARALALSHWETARDCDLYLAKVSGDEELFNRVYYGTPYSIYRERITAVTVRQHPSAPAAWLKLGAEASVQVRVDIEGGTVGGREVLKPGSVLHRLLCALSKDLYRPVRAASLHQSLFPGEHFHVEHSPNRVHQTVFRLRRELDAAGSGIEIEREKSFYRLKFQPGTLVRISKQDNVQSPVSRLIHQAAAALTNVNGVSSQEISQALGCNLRFVQRLLKQAQEEGLVTRTLGPRPLYCFATKRRAA